MTVCKKKILDATCGARTMWFDKQNPHTVFFDKRCEHYDGLWKNSPGSTLDIVPDVVGDFTHIPYEDNLFALVVFDPPHLTGAKETSWLVKKYGKLGQNWEKMLRDGFRECMRVLKPDGVLSGQSMTFRPARFGRRLDKIRYLDIEAESNQEHFGRAL